MGNSSIFKLKNSSKAKVISVIERMKDETGMETCRERLNQMFRFYFLKSTHGKDYMEDVFLTYTYLLELLAAAED
jgi:hypothetical protein